MEGELAKNIRWFSELVYYLNSKEKILAPAKVLKNYYWFVVTCIHKHAHIHQNLSTPFSTSSAAMTWCSLHLQMVNVNTVESPHQKSLTQVSDLIMTSQAHPLTSFFSFSQICLVCWITDSFDMSVCCLTCSIMIFNCCTCCSRLLAICKISQNPIITATTTTSTESSEISMFYHGLQLVQ